MEHRRPVGADGALLRALHDATAGFVPPDGAVWQPSWLRDLGGDDLGHRALIRRALIRRAAGG